MPRLELWILQFGERHWDAFIDLKGYQRSLTRGGEVQHDFETSGSERRSLPSETFAQVILCEHYDAGVDVSLIPSVTVQTWRRAGQLRVRLSERLASEAAFAQIPTELKVRSFRSTSHLRLSIKPEALEVTLRLFGDAPHLVV